MKHIRQNFTESSNKFGLLVQQTRPDSRVTLCKKYQKFCSGAGIDDLFYISNP